LTVKKEIRSETGSLEGWKQFKNTIVKATVVCGETSTRKW
jgi:hypothetical protein